MKMRITIREAAPAATARLMDVQAMARLTDLLREFSEGGGLTIEAATSSPSTWALIENAPRDRPIVVYAPGRDGLQEMASICQWHPDAGFCIDELREPTLWTELPAAGWRGK